MTLLNTYVIPISNFTIESAFKLDEIYFTPPLTAIENGFSYNDTITNTEFTLIKNYLISLNKITNYDWTNYTFAIISSITPRINSVQQVWGFVNEICEKIDRSLDYIRLRECVVGKFETLPGLPGIINEGGKTIFEIDKESNVAKSLFGELTIFIKQGIGLLPNNEPSKSDFQNIDYHCIFSNRDDEVFLNCRYALTRINEAMYMQNLNTAFVYLMTTLEMIADNNNYINFKKVKPKILPFICNSKNEYHKLSEELTSLSKETRTNIVHNGMNIYNFYDNPDQIVKVLFRITSFIHRYVTAVISTGIKSFDVLETERIKLIERLDV